MSLRGEFHTMARVCALTAATAAVTIACAGSAHAAVSLSAKISPSNSGTPDKPTPASVNVSAKISGAPVGAVDGSGATKSIEAKLPFSLLFNPVAFPACTRDQVLADACSARAQIGTGRVIGQAAGGIVETLKLTAYNGEGYSLLLLVEGTTPLRINSVLRGTVRSGEGAYGLSLLNEVPENLQQPVTGVFTTVTEFSLKVDAKRKIGGKTVSYISTGGCPGGRWPFSVTVTYRNDKTESGSASSRCTK